MSFTWTKSAAFAASAALLSLAVVPALAQPDEVQTPPEEVQPQEVPSGVERQSKPKYTKDTPRDLSLRQAAPRFCVTKADSKEEAEEICQKTLKCQPPKKTVCKERGNLQDFRCECQ